MEKEKKEDTYDILLSRDDSEDYNVNTFVKEKNTSRTVVQSRAARN